MAEFVCQTNTTQVNHDGSFSYVKVKRLVRPIIRCRDCGRYIAGSCCWWGHHTAKDGFCYRSVPREDA